MPRPPRLLVPDGVYHVTSRGNRRQRIFLADRDYRRFLRDLGIVAKRHRWRVHTYCLMPNHFHLLVQTPDADLSTGMQALKGGYAQWFNRRHNFDGHLFQGRFYAGLVESNWHVLELARYIVLNPVRAGLVRHVGEWPWSSYRAFIGKAPRPRFLETSWVLSQFGREPKRAREAYARFVADGLPRAPP